MSPTKKAVIAWVAFLLALVGLTAMVCSCDVDTESTSHTDNELVRQEAYE